MPTPISTSTPTNSATAKVHTIALVDDDPGTLDVLTRYFEHHGFGVISARDGKTGLDLIKKHKPSLVILDVMLPQVDGFTVSQQLRNHEPPIPVIMLTARVDPQDRLRGLMAGAYRYLTKPCSPVKVMDEAVKLLGLPGRPRPVTKAEEDFETQTEFDALE